MSTLYFASAASVCQPAVRTFFGAFTGFVPPGVSFNVPTAGETIDDNTGAINGTWSFGTGGAQNGTNAGAYAAGVGARIVWETAGITGGRRVRGSTFIAPIVVSQYEGDGTIANTLVTAFTTAANALWTTSGIDQVILTRLTAAHSGTSHPVTGVRVPDAVTWLRSRRT